MLNSPVFKRKKDSKAFQVLIISYIEIFRGLRLFVPDGFCWDGASIPRVLWRLYGHPLTNKYQAAAVVHDWLYKIKGEYDWGYSMTRKEVDQLFYHMLRADGVGFIKARMLYRGVRAGGWMSFRKKSPTFTEE